MKLKEVSPKILTNRYERACARLARIARNDTVFGGARAMVLAKRFNLKEVPAGEIVSDVYAASNYMCGEWGVYECPECGQAYLGTKAALNCCVELEYFTRQDELNEE